MFYWEDKKIKYEYGIYCKVGSGLPYIRSVHSDMKQIYIAIEEIEKRHNHYRQLFYIDNDFYKNKYSLECGGTYYKVLRRPILEWEEFETVEKPQYNNVINFFK